MGPSYSEPRGAGRRKACSSLRFFAGPTSSLSFDAVDWSTANATIKGRASRAHASIVAFVALSADA